MKKRTWSRCRNAVSTVRKSQASALAACWRRNARHDGRARSGAGGRPAPISTLRTEVAETVTPRPLSSPTMRRYPPWRFSRASRRIRVRSDRSSGGRPGALVRICPASCDKLAMPAQQRLRLHRKARPRPPRQRAAQRGQERAVSSGDLWTAGLPTQDRQLVSEDQDLQFLRATRAGQQRHEREQIPDDEIDKRPEQARASHS